MPQLMEGGQGRKNNQRYQITRSRRAIFFISHEVTWDAARQTGQDINQINFCCGWAIFHGQYGDQNEVHFFYPNGKLSYHMGMVFKQCAQFRLGWVWAGSFWDNRFFGTTGFWDNRFNRWVVQGFFSGQLFLWFKLFVACQGPGFHVAHCGTSELLREQCIIRIAVTAI